MDNTKKKIISIWGYGKVGKSFFNFFAPKNNVFFYIMDQNKDAINESVFNEKTVLFSQPTNIQLDLSFFKDASSICISPGIDIKNYYPTLKKKLITEVDLFCSAWSKPIIGITGSVGKTTITHFISMLLKMYAIKTVAGGNIGTPMLDIISSDASYAVLELSSFQLEYSTSFHPQIAIWTNLYPNHLDRHMTEENYFKAKYKLIERQTGNEISILPTSLIPYLNRFGWPKSKIIFIEDEKTYSQSILDTYPLFKIKDSMLSLHANNSTRFICHINQLPSTTITQNWLTIAATLYSLNILDHRFIENIHSLESIPHRTEFVLCHQGITFINDSKSTTIASTIAAIEKYGNQAIILIIGGLSKGVDRSVLFQKIPSNIIHILIFGNEKNTLFELCTQYTTIPSEKCNSLEQVIEKALVLAPQKSIVLFSPAGSSYDLYKNYEDRGAMFKNIVKTKIAIQSKNLTLSSLL